MFLDHDLRSNNQGFQCLHQGLSHHHHDHNKITCSPPYYKGIHVPLQPSQPHKKTFKVHHAIKNIQNLLNMCGFKTQTITCKGVSSHQGLHQRSFKDHISSRYGIMKVAPSNSRTNKCGSKHIFRGSSSTSTTPRDLQGSRYHL